MRKTLICFLMALLSIGLIPYLPAEGADINYTVNTADNLFRISLKTGVTISELKQLNNLTDDVIYTGQILQVPPTSAMETYMVQAGDNLYRIAQRHNLTIQQIKNANGLSGNLIKLGQKIIIPSSEHISIAKNEPSDKPGENSTPQTKQTSSDKTVLSNKVISSEDKNLLAKLIYAEARGETLEGKTAVGAVIMNRLKDPKFPKSIKEVIYEKRGNVYQFSPVGNGSINMEPDTTAFKAADEALQGYDPSDGALFFYNPEKTDDQWIRTLPEKCRIGNHIFAK